jgi:hypothetical protein
VVRQTYPVLASPVVVCSPPSCGVSKGPDRPREDGQQRQVQPWTAPSGAVAGPIVALAMVGRTQHRWREGSLVTAPATQRTIIGGRPDCAVTNRDGAGQVRRLIPSRRWRAPAVSRRRKVGAGRSGSHGPRRRSPSCCPADPPIRIARAGLLEPVARNRIRFIEIAIHPRRNRPDIPCPRNGPFRLNRQVPGRNL